jgi:cytochrome c
MKLKGFLLLLAALLMFASCSKKREGDPKVLVFSKTMGFRHASIPKGIEAIKKLGETNGFSVDTTENASRFNDDNLKQYSAIIFLSTTGDVLDHYQEAAFERYIQSGGGYVGIHAATDTEYDWGWYNKLSGANFLSHPAGTPEADFIIKDRSHPATEMFTDSIWHRVDELYNFKQLNPDVNVLMTVDESTYEGGMNGDHHPMSWYHDFDGGRAFYTAAGHTDESFTEDLFLQHLMGGISYAIGENLELDYDQAHSQIPPEANRFAKIKLSEGQFYEPTEMTVLPNSDVLIGQRRGEIMLYSEATGELTQVAALDVYHKTLNTPGVNAEEGLMGLQKDPDYANNHWIYVYYAPTGDAWVNKLSRFKYQDGNFDLESEQVILEVDSQREICCHTGGSIAFGPDNMLYLSTGDNSTPFNEADAKYVNSGYAPLNDLPGREQFDARRSSGNTNDLRGKILRIIVNEDGSYDIPEGNLFAPGTEKTRPEIFTMGHRNPYRISVDVKRGWVYWGDVGPDARADSLDTRGPRGYDEMNQAREAGNFGWPLFIGNNYAYRDYDYETGESGEAFDPEKPINDSRNNTGLQELPPAQPAYVYYPYVETGDFPQVGTGGRNAMAGPVWYSDVYAGEGAIPEYYDGKVIIYEWMRGWMKAVHLFEDGTFNKMEPFASDIEVSNLIDMEVGPDGRIYLLEYGSGWFTKNDDSGLSYIEYNGGNRAPLIEGLEMEVTSGKAPLTVNAAVAAKDLEGDAMKYHWFLGNGDSLVTDQPNISYTYQDTGEYQLDVRVSDDGGKQSEISSSNVFVGNTRPELEIVLSGGNSSFFIPGVPVGYEVKVKDEGSAEGVNLDNVYVSVDYREGMDDASLSAMGHQQASAIITGKALTQSMDCKTCHKENGPSIGPSYMEVSQKYQEGRRSVNMRYLMEKIVEGGSGVWGEVMMPAHPNVTAEEKRQIAEWILSLADTRPKEPSLPVVGSVTPEGNQAGNTMVISASYTDEGMNGIKPLTGSTMVALRGNTVSFPPTVKKEGMMEFRFNGMDIAILNEAAGWLELKQLDMSGVSSVMLTMGWQAPPEVGFDFELRSGSPDGELLGSGSLQLPQNGPGAAVILPITTASTGKQDLYLTYKKQDSEAEAMVALMNAMFQ